VLDLPQFVSLLEERLGAELPGATADSRLREDLALDSLAMIEVLVVLDDLGVRLPDDLIPALTTLGDLYHYYTVLAPRGPGGKGEPDGPARAVGS
jgi:acyl carrier protein